MSATTQMDMGAKALRHGLLYSQRQLYTALICLSAKLLCTSKQLQRAFWRTVDWEPIKNDHVRSSLNTAKPQKGPYFTVSSKRDKPFLNQPCRMT